MSGYLCLCSHPQGDHDTGNGREPCSRRLHRACGCDEYRLDTRSPVRDESSEDAATTKGAA